jgi:hypothetical protein
VSKKDEGERKTWDKAILKRLRLANKLVRLCRGKRESATSSELQRKGTHAKAKVVRKVKNAWAKPKPA